MQFGVHLPHIGRNAGPEELGRFARVADRLGFHSGWVSDHIAWPSEIESTYPYSDDGSFPAGPGMPWLDPLGALTFVAAQTERLRLGTTVLILGYRPPVQTAKLVSTLDVLSAGRVILGVGVGWMREEFEVLGMPFDHRGARGDEQLEIFETLFTEASPSYNGRFYSFPGIGFGPKPVHGHIPIWVGGNTDSAFRRTARFGDGFHAAFTELDELAEHWGRVQAACEAANRDPSRLDFSVRLWLDFDGLADQRKGLSGPVDRILDGIERHRKIGVTHLLLDIVARGGVDGRLEAMQRFAAEIIPKVG